MTKPFQTYPGGKNSPGVTQTLINLIPAGIKCYISPTLGNDPIIRNIKAFDKIILSDIDQDVYEAWKGYWKDGCSYLRLDLQDVFEIVDLTLIYRYTTGFNEENLIFLDPPYLHETRRSGADIYKHEFTHAMHMVLLRRANQLSNHGFKLMICCYPNDLYHDALSEWNYLDYKSTTRQGQVTERVYFNYPKPTDLHDFSFYGDNFRVREQIKRKKNSLVKKLMELPENIRQYAINDVMLTLKSLNP